VSAGFFAALCSAGFDGISLAALDLSLRAASAALDLATSSAFLIALA